MTISSATNKSGPYTENGVTDTFAYAFKIEDETHVKVVRAASGVETVLTLTTDYTVTGVGNDGGGNVVINTPVSGSTLTLVLDVPFVQELDLENQGAYFAESVEAALDLAVQRDKQLQEQINRAVVVPVSADVADLDTLVSGILTLEPISADITTVAGISGNVTTVAGIDSDVTTVAGNATNVTTVAGISADVTAVAADAADIGTVAGAIANVTTVAGIAANVTTVAGVASDVTTVATNIADVTSAATNMAAILDAPNQADLARRWAVEAQDVPVTGGQFSAFHWAKKAEGFAASIDPNSFVPAGTSIMFNGSVAPTGYLKENGAAVSRTAYAALYAAIGTTFGAGDGSTTFNLPDSRGEFIRGWDDGRGVDSGRALGSWQADQNKAHTHTGTTANDSHSHTGSTNSTGAHTHTVTGASSGNFAGAGGGGASPATQTTSSAGAHSHTFTTSSDTHNHTFTTASEGGTEARPRNVSKLICIKY